MTEHSDDNNDGEIGWGLREPWDAFGDGSINPENHVYAIEVANVLDALVATLELNILEDELKREIIKLIHDTTVIWHEKYWTYRNDDGKCFYWYSISKEDEIECANINTKLAGTFAKVIRIYEEEFSYLELYDINKKINLTIQRIVDTSYIKEEGVVWSYSEIEKEKINDVSHHAFIVEGLIDYQIYNNQFKLPWQKEELCNYFEQCIDTDSNKLYSYPDFSYWRLYDVGALPLMNNKKRNCFECYVGRICFESR